MQVMNWKIKRLGALLLITVLLYMWMYPRQFSYKEEVTIARVQPNEVWEYVADFSNMMNLNPTIVDFSITSESGNYEHWQYSTQYTEHLSHWPYLKNYGTAQFSIHSNWRKSLYFINSTHTTCFAPAIFCLNSDSEFKFSLMNNINVGAMPDTKCEEIVHYQCPPIMYFYCKREVVYQRKAIMESLKKRFEHKNI